MHVVDPMIFEVPDQQQLQRVVVCVVHQLTEHVLANVYNLLVNQCSLRVGLHELHDALHLGVNVHLHCRNTLTVLRSHNFVQLPHMSFLLLLRQVLVYGSFDLVGCHLERSANLLLRNELRSFSANLRLRRSPCWHARCGALLGGDPLVVAVVRRLVVIGILNVYI